MTTRAASPRQRRSDGEQTWRRVLDAAVESIVELGYYRASSNEIARRAGVTWGVIQHQFGTREGLLLAVLNDNWVRMEQHIAQARVEGETLEQRIASLFEVLAAYYGRTEHLAQLQILLDLSANPGTSQETRDAVAAHGEALLQSWQPLFDSALGAAARDPELVRFAFLTLRAYLTGSVIAGRIAAMADDAVVKQLLVDGVAATVRAEAERRGLTSGR
jgi:AcrR family transcriptional regulator